MPVAAGYATCRGVSRLVVGVLCESCRFRFYRNRMAPSDVFVIKIVPPAIRHHMASEEGFHRGVVSIEATRARAKSSLLVMSSS